MEPYDYDDTSIFEGTIWEWIYPTFGVEGDIALCRWMSNIGLAYTAVVGVYSLIQPAPYGRYSSSKFGPTINAKLAWMIQESPSFLIPTLLALTTSRSQLGNVPNSIALGMFLTHYFHRSFIFPLALGKNAKSTPIVTTFSAVVFCSYNGFLQGHHLINTEAVEGSYFRYFVGISLFVAGMVINVTHDRILMGLKEEAAAGRNEDEGSSAPEGSQEVSKQYKIPRGYLFNYISGANYFGEILEWWSLALFTGGYPQLAFAVFASTFLGIRAYHHHQFYKKTFGDTYPAERRAIIPFLL